MEEYGRDSLLQGVRSLTTREWVNELFKPVLVQFLSDPKRTEFHVPVRFNSEQRHALHLLADEFDLLHASYGK
jgi:hypothetical protein